MALRVVFCSARDGDVTLAVRSPDWTRHLVLDPEPSGSVGCLALGRSCSGALCPFCASAASAPERAEARSVLPGVSR
jgi:hypothetical protein